MITEQRALEIAKEVGLYVMLPVGYEKQFTRALNLATAEALEYGAGSSLVDPVSRGYLEGLANDYREAAK